MEEKVIIVTFDCIEIGETAEAEFQMQKLVCLSQRDASGFGVGQGGPFRAPAFLAVCSCLVPASARNLQGKCAAVLSPPNRHSPSFPAQG